MTSDMNMVEKKEETLLVKQELLKRVEDSKELEMPSWMTCGDVSLSHLKKSEHDYDKIVVEEPS